MIKQILLLILILFSISCQENSEEKHADDFENCFSEEEVDLLNQATYHFEQMLSGHYDTTDNESNLNNFLNDISSPGASFRFPYSFYSNEKSISIVNELEKIGTFEKIWKKYIEKDSDEEYEVPIVAPPGYVEPEEPKLVVYSLDPNGDYLNCLNEIIENDRVKEVLNSTAEFGNVSPNLTASAFKDILSKNDLDKGLNKVIIAIGVYYETVILLDKNREK